MVGPRPKIKFTYQDYKNAPEDKRYELLDGDLVVAPSPRIYHQDISLNLEHLLWTFIKEGSLGRVYHAPIDVVLSDTDVVQPDILFVSNEGMDIITEDNVRGGPDLVIEILSPSTAERDRTFKRSLYARHGVREYWLVDPEAKSVEVLVLGEGHFEIVATYGQDEELTSPMLGGLRLNLNEVFR